MLAQITQMVTIPVFDLSSASEISKLHEYKVRLPDGEQTQTFSGLRLRSKGVTFTCYIGINPSSTLDLGDRFAKEYRSSSRVRVGGWVGERLIEHRKRGWGESYQLYQGQFLLQCHIYYSSLKDQKRSRYFIHATASQLRPRRLDIKSR